MNRKSILDDIKEYDIKKPISEIKARVEPGGEYCHRIILKDEVVSEVIYDFLINENPCMIARFGDNELRALMAGLSEKFPTYFLTKRNLTRKYINFFEGAGFFPQNINLLPRYADLMIDACESVDMLGVWFNRYEDFIIEHFCDENTKLCGLGKLEAYSDLKNPWSKALEGKKVLVIHPFEQSIKSQYKRRTELFGEYDVLPNFELITLKAVQTIAGMKDNRFKDWFEALEYMHKESQQIDFDVAIIGCGAYGFPLAAMIKRDGKKAIHLGGATQVMFGIKGKRWDDNPYISKLYNDSWCYPMDEETPLKKFLVEGGTYWKP